MLLYKHHLILERKRKKTQIEHILIVKFDINKSTSSGLV